MNREATVIIIAYDGFGNELSKHDSFGRLDPVVQLLEFMMNMQSLYPNITRFEMTIAY